MKIKIYSCKIVDFNPPAQYGDDDDDDGEDNDDGDDDMLVINRPAQ